MPGIPPDVRSLFRLPGNARLMGQQPNIELSLSEHPIGELQRAAERRWIQSRPGEITSPSDVPSGGSFGRPGPDTGWGLRMIRAMRFDRGKRPRDLEVLLNALAGARASHARRGPTRQDVEVALALVGLHEDPRQSKEAAARLEELREKWLDYLAHDPWPGRSALADIPLDLLMDTPPTVRARLRDDPFPGI